MSDQCSRQPMPRQFAYIAVAALIAGVTFTLGVYIVAMAIEAWENTPQKERPERVEAPSEVEFVDHGLVADQPSLTIDGALRSTATQPWQSVTLQATIFAGGVRMNGCWDSMDNLAPEVERRFRIVCEDVGGMNLPDNITYRIEVLYATRFPPSGDLGGDVPNVDHAGTERL